MKFCEVNFFNDDAFLKHLKKDHMFCDFCDKKHAYIYYDRYENLKRHFQKSHYACEEPECDNQYVVFKRKDQLDRKSVV